MSVNSGKSTIKISDDMRKRLDALQNAAPARIRLTPEQEAIILEYYPKKDKAALAQTLGMSRSALLNKYKDLVRRK